jgi:hypothetical protein
MPATHGGLPREADRGPTGGASAGCSGVVLGLVLVVGATWVLSMPQFGGRLDGERLARARANPH